MKVLTILGFAALLSSAACGGNVVSPGDPMDEPTAVAVVDGGPDVDAPCGIHETIDWPTYFNSDAPEFVIETDAGVYETCVRGDAGPFYLCNVSGKASL